MTRFRNFVILLVSLFVTYNLFAQETALLTTANKAFIRAESLKKQSQPETFSLYSFSRGVAPLALPTPKAAEVNFSFAGVDDKNNVRVQIDVSTEFPPVNPMRVSVNGSRTTKDGVFQTTSDASPRSPYGLAGNAVAEIHGLQVILPGKIGFNGIETQIDWNTSRTGTCRSSTILVAIQVFV